MGNTEKLVKSNGWTYYQNDRDPPHFPQDRTGKIGAMDRKPALIPDRKVWNMRYREFLNEKKRADDQGINSRKKEEQFAARAIFGKYVEEWNDYVLLKNYDTKIAFMIPEIGNHSILAFTNENNRDFHGIDRGDSPVIGLKLEEIKIKKDDKDKYRYDYDFN